MYFRFTTFIQRLSMLIILHPDFAAREDPKALMSFIPHPPHSFGLSNFPRKSRGALSLSLL